MQFDFGKNWVDYSRRALTGERIARARSEFLRLFDGIDLKGKSFLDIGFGQGMSLLFAKEAGARAFGNDINPKCKEALALTAAALKTSPDVPVVIGSVLDPAVVSRLSAAAEQGKFDIVHSWGVLHHTGNMSLAIRSAAGLVQDNGFFVLAIYNRHWSNRLWLCIKWLYCACPAAVQKALIAVFCPVIAFAKFCVTGKSPFGQQRGMDFYYNVIDWVGGYPYEYAGIPEMISFVSGLGFSCIKSIGAEVPTGCNEFVFKKDPVRESGKKSASGSGQ